MSALPPRWMRFDSGTSWFAVCESDPDLRTIYKAFQTHNASEGTKSQSTTSIVANDSHSGSLAPEATKRQGTTSVVPQDAEKKEGALAPEVSLPADREPVHTNCRSRHRPAKFQVACNLRDIEEQLFQISRHCNFFHRIGELSTGNPHP